MKVVFLGDLHFGVSDDDEWIHSKMYDTLVFIRDYCVKNKIKRILQAGDVFDTRKAIQHKTMEFVRTKIIPLFDGTDIKIDMIVGNHDAKYKNTIIPNALTEVLGQYKFINVIEHPVTLKIGTATIDMIPWICKDNNEEISEFIKNSTSKFCMGHFELAGFYYYQGFKSNGSTTEFLDKYKYVYSGHFHTISSNYNISYLGTPYTITNNDVNDIRGFWVFDTVLENHEFVQNPVMNHYKLIFDADTWTDDPKNYKDKAVTLIVNKEEGKVNLDKILDEFEKETHIFKYTIIQQTSNDILDNSDNVQLEKTSDIIDYDINTLIEDDTTKSDIKKLFDQLYIEALNDS